MSPATPVPFGRVMTAMVTPFDDAGDVDLEAAAALATHLVDHGHDGLVVSGTTGESPTVDPGEQRDLLRAVVGAVGDRASIVAGAGTNDTAHSVQLARNAEAAGAAGLLLVTPYYSKPSQDAILTHFRTIAAATGLPVMMYDIPGRTGVKLAADTLARAGEHDRIVAVKDATGDLYAGSWLLRTTDLAIYSGDDALNLAWLSLGAAGVVSVIGHVAGPRLAELVTAVDKGDLEYARELDRALLPAVEAIMNQGPGVVMVKAALQLLGLLPNRNVRAPHLPATEAQVADLRRGLVAAHIVEDAVR
jgi:4-hydroxy-tetrahydrodipicolinate synthase